MAEKRFETFVEWLCTYLETLLTLMILAMGCKKIGPSANEVYRAVRSMSATIARNETQLVDSLLLINVRYRDVLLCAGQNPDVEG